MITKEYNQYDQYGVYFVAAWTYKPSLEEIKITLSCGDEEAEHILNGGGRQEFDQEWYNLFEYPEGENYHD